MYNILVTGGNGQLGSELREIAQNYQDYNFLFTDVKDLDITNHNAVVAYIKSNKINVIINCAAYTSVDKAESEPKLSDAINHLAVANFAQIAKDKNIKLIHISTDYVFDGDSKKSLTSDCPTNPVTIYGLVKLKGEKAIQKIAPENTIIIRTSWVYSKFGNNFPKTIIRLSKINDSLNVVNDQLGTPTHAKDLAKVILDILPNLKNKNPEIYHYSNEGQCTWYEFALKILELFRSKTIVRGVSTHEYPTKAKRPLYSVLNKEKIKSKYNFTIPHWEDSLKEFVDDFDANYQK